MTKQQEKSLKYYNDLIKYVNFFEETLRIEAFLCFYNTKQDNSSSYGMLSANDIKLADKQRNRRAGDFKTKKEVIALASLASDIDFKEISKIELFSTKYKITNMMGTNCTGSWFWGNPHRLMFIDLCIKLVKKEKVTPQDILNIYK